MFSSKSHLVIALLGLAALVLAASTSAQNSSEDQSGARVRGLLIEKRDALARSVEYAESLHRQGTIQAGAVLDARLELLDAELALADSAVDRLKILEERLDNRRSKESQLEELHKSGTATFGEKIDATVQRIDAAIALSKASSGN